MSPLSTVPIPGTRDFFPEEMSVRQQVFERLYRVVESFGYLRYDAPMVEPFELYAAKSGSDLVNQQVYRFTDRGERDLAIRPEMTPSVARMIAARAGQLVLPARWYSHPNLWRYERKQRGRYREHWQVNVDLFGTESWEAEAEILEILAEMMFAVGAKTSDFLLRVSDRQLVVNVLQQQVGLDPQQVAGAFGVLDAIEKVGPEETAAHLAKLGLSQAQADRTIQLLTHGEQFLEQAAPESLQQSNVARALSKLVTSQPVNVKFDPLIIRGFEYYTSSVFEVFDTNPENPRSIAGGGRYDNLVALFGKPRIPGIGFGMGDVTLIDFLQTHKIAPAPQIAPEVQVMTPDESLRQRVKEIAASLRQEGLRVVTPLDSRKLGKLLERAAKEGVRCVVIAGGDELARGAVKLRDLGRSEEREIALTALPVVIRETLATPTQEKP